ncbi:MAG: type I methionyl aminopeptidase [Sphingobium sp.]
MTTYVDVTKDTLRSRTNAIKLYGSDAFEGMHRAGRIAAETLDALVPLVVPGVSTGELDDFARDAIVAAGAVPINIGYKGYAHATCISVNHIVCHGIPGSKTLVAGDILNIDLTAVVDGWHGDTSRMFLVGDVPLKAKRLVDVTYEAMMLGIAQARAGNHLGDIGHAIQRHAEQHRYGVVRDFVGHGVGLVYHDEPDVYHYGRPGTGPELRPGMIFTIEPMINIGKPGVKILDDDWTAVTRDRSLSAQFEHSIGITEGEAEIFTLSPKGLHHPPYR